MKYYKDKIDFRHELTRKDYYSMRRRKNAHETMCVSCGADWLEGVNARAQVIEDKSIEDNIAEYYPNYMECQTNKTR